MCVQCSPASIGLVHAVADRRVVARILLARADVDDVRIARRDGDGADRRDGLLVEDRLERDAAVGGLDDAAVGAGDVVHVAVAGDAGDDGAQRRAGRRRSSSRPAGRRTHTGCATRPTTSRAWSGPVRTGSRSSLGNGWYRGRLGFQGRGAFYGDRLAAARPARGHHRGRAASTRFGTRRHLDRRESARRSPTTSTTASAPTSAVRRREPRTRSTCSTPTWAWLVAPDGPPVRSHRVLPAGRGQYVARPARRWSTSARTSSAGCGSRSTRRRRATSHRCGTRRCSRTASSASARCAPPRPPTTFTSPGRRGARSSRAFTFHGFRYAEITGWPASSTRTTSRPSCVHTDMAPHRLVRRPRDPLLNRLHENVVWGMRGNFLDVPTDCPQRDERLGWTGDIQVFAPTASFLYDSAGFLDVLAARPRRRAGSSDGVGPVRRAGRAHDARRPAAGRVGRRRDRRAVGALRALRRPRPCSPRQYASMRAWVDTVAGAGRRRPAVGAAASSSATGSTRPRRRTTRRQRQGRPATSSPPPTSPAPPRLVAEAAERARRRRRTPRTYARAGRAQSARAFVAEYVTAGRPHAERRARPPTRSRSSSTCSPTPSAAAARRPTGSPSWSRDGGYRIATGFVGTPLISDALAAAGHLDAGVPPAAADRAARRGCTRSRWARPRSGSAGTACCPTARINPGEMTSFNHYALGAVADWMHRTVGGPRAGEPGYRAIAYGRCLTVATSPPHRASTSRRTARPRSRGRGPDGELRLSVTVPVGSRAQVAVPGASEPVEVGHGTHEWTATYAETPGAARGADGPATHRPRVQLGRPSSPRPSRPRSSPTTSELAARLERYLDLPASRLVDAISRRDFSPLPSPAGETRRPARQLTLSHRPPPRCRCPEETSPWRSR